MNQHQPIEFLFKNVFTFSVGLQNSFTGSLIKFIKFTKFRLLNLSIKPRIISFMCNASHFLSYTNTTQHIYTPMNTMVHLIIQIKTKVWRAKKKNETIKNNDCSRTSLREKLRIDKFECVFSYNASGTFSLETAINSFYFSFGETCCSA